MLVLPHQPIKKEYESYPVYVTTITYKDKTIEIIEGLPGDVKDFTRMEVEAFSKEEIDTIYNDLGINII